jgi:hypothetical protein
LGVSYLIGGVWDEGQRGRADVGGTEEASVTGAVGAVMASVVSGCRGEQGSSAGCVERQGSS